MAPSSAKKWVCRSRTWRIGSAIGVRRVTQSVAEEIESQDHDDDRQGNDKEPWREAQGLQILGVVQEDSPGDRRGAQAEAQKRKCRFADDHGGQRQADGGDYMRQKAG